MIAAVRVVAAERQLAPPARVCERQSGARVDANAALALDSVMPGAERERKRARARASERASERARESARARERKQSSKSSPVLFLPLDPHRRPLCY